MSCLLAEKPPVKPAKDCSEEEYKIMYAEVFDKCGDCCFFACNGGLGCDHEEVGE